MKKKIVLAIVFYLYFLILTPLGVFNDWIPLSWQTGFYYVTNIDSGDDAGYYAYLRSGFFDGDFDFINERNYAHAERLNPTGYVFNNWQIGQSILFLPFFLLGHFLAWVLNALGYPCSLDGYSAPYYFSTAVASATYVFIGLLLLMRMLEKIYGENIALIAVLAVWMGSPLVYFTFIRQRMAHSSEFFVIALFLYFWMQRRKSEFRASHAFLGALFGFLCMVRIINVLYLFLYVADQFWLCLSDPRRPREFKPFGVRVAVFAAMSILTLLPQLYSWNQLDGPPFAYIVKSLSVMGKNSQAAGSSGVLWNKVYDLMIGPQWSVLFSTPVLFLGCLGIVAFRFQPRELLPGFAAFFAVFLALLLTAVPSASFGNRWLLPGLGVFAFGFSSLLEKVFRKPWLFKSFLAFTVLCVVAQCLMIAQYQVVIEYNDPKYTYKALGNIPWLIAEHPSSLSLSTNWARLMFLDHAEKWDYNDYLFLAIFPGMQLAAIGLTLIAYARIRRAGEGRPVAFNPRIVLGGAGSVVAVLMVLVGVLAPTKAPQEIAARREFSGLIKRGDLLLSQGKPDEAVRAFDRASQLIPDNWRPAFRKGTALSAKKDWKGAERNFREALALNPDDFGVQAQLGFSLYLLGEFSEAEYHLKSVLRKSPYNLGLYSVLSEVYAKQNKVQEVQKLSVSRYGNGK
ncbi:MAG: tetratricopeptide repeat protein [Nitrospinae bacterium]|nr:tetratricopeptide repeat protein [Nitrospinota bacterium]